MNAQKDQKNTKWTQCAHISETHTAWSRISDGKTIYVIYPNDQKPTPESGGYFNFESALKIKGIH